MKECFFHGKGNREKEMNCERRFHSNWIFPVMENNWFQFKM